MIRLVYQTRSHPHSSKKYNLASLPYFFVSIQGNQFIYRLVTNQHYWIQTALNYVSNPIMSLLRSQVVQKPYQLFHYYFLSEKRSGNTLADLSFETNPRLTINYFTNRSWSRAEVCHYSFLSSIIFFVFVIFPAPSCSSWPS